MSKKLKRVLCGLTAFLLAASSVACGEEVREDQDTTVDDTSVSVDDGSDELKPDLPDVNYGGREFRVGYHIQDNTESLLFKDTDSGEIVDSAIYNRNIALEEKYGIELKFINSGYPAGEFAEKLYTSIAADDDAYDICIGNGNYFVKYLATLPYVDYHDVPYLEFDKPWWNSGSVDELTICGKMYLYSPMITQQSVSNLHVLVTNMDLMEDNNIEMPYQLVKDGKWTIDELFNMVKDIYVDVNGNTTKDAGDIFGYTCYAQRESWGCAFDVKVFEEVDDELKITLDTDKMSSIIDKIYSFYFDQSGTYVTTDYTIGGVVQTDYHRNLFAAGNVMISEMEIKYIGDELRYSTINYGVLPMPKWDEEQEAYASSGGGQTVVIPKTNPDLEFTGIILDAMCYETYERIIPAYYQFALKEKILQNEDDKAMVDIITDSARSWAPYMYGSYTGLGGIVDTLMVKKTKDFSSWYASMKKSAELSIKGLQEILADE